MNTNHKFALQRVKNEFEIQQHKKPHNRYIVVYRSIKKCIEKLELPHDWLLPSTRLLATELNLSRTTIIKSYELLLLEKLIVSKTGSGYRVNYLNEDTNKIKKTQSVIHPDLYPKISEKAISYLNNISLINRLSNKNLAFLPGVPPVDIFPINQWKKLMNTYWRHVKSSGLSYSQSTGLHELKRSISNYLNICRNVKCHPEQIVIVSGSLQSLYLIANTLLNKNDSVVLENPIFPNVHSVFKSSQANLIPVGLDEEGIRLDELKNISNLKPKILHLTPSNHYPLGTKMTLQRRFEVLQWASENKAFIIENDYENEIANLTSNIPCIYSLDKEDRTIYMGTFNRLLHPSIRLGYMVVPNYLIQAVEALQEHSHRFVSPSLQMVMNQFINKNYLYQHLKNAINEAKERHEIFISEFQKECQSMYIHTKDFSSFHIVALFNKETTIEQEKEIINQLNNENITAYSLSKCYIKEPVQTGLILGYSSVRTQLIKKEIKKMGKIL
ncbi:GntR family transcriptional regulator / MocR family aminotransferase [Flavobacterium sp. 9AF]|uniref:MocR-like pyridoxine biosynthesis transcription factor PdxR n=1 Tax=Flavobacterium sp. 9AF TaxID=2653142 RepID=UPI0012EF9A0D|nr:PLP-dependent aminotransferase family protein [Flavobacterium sp. 9AF]VXB05487.1 GntR family transcriptional regulator / MocR family aminotransferase [Flavobacterium sp. 9AF]